MVILGRESDAAMRLVLKTPTRHSVPLRRTENRGKCVLSLQSKLYSFQRMEQQVQLLPLSETAFQACWQFRFGNRGAAWPAPP